MSEVQRTIITRIQNKYDTSSEWLLNNPVLLIGEIGFESDTGKFKLGDGITNWENLPYAAVKADEIELLDSKIKLEEDLYTNYNIGRIKNASESNPVKIGEKGYTIKELFNNIFRAKAEMPTITYPSLSLSLTSNSTDIEYGKEVTFYATITASKGRFNSSYYSGGYTTATGVTWNNLNLVSTNSTFSDIVSDINSGTKFEIVPTSKYYAVSGGGTIKAKATAPDGYISDGTTAKNNRKLGFKILKLKLILIHL